MLGAKRKRALAARKANPAGLFRETNPAVTCSGYAYSLAEDAPHLVSHPQH
jgi:hypothetical protein